MAHDSAAPSRRGPLLFGLATFLLGLLATTVYEVAGRATIYDRVEKFMFEASHEGGPNCQNVGWLNPVLPEQLDASATRTYVGEGQVAHVASRTLDGDSTTAWAGLFVDEAGEGEPTSLTVRFFGDSQSIRLLCIRNGYAANGHVYENNLRIKEARLTGCREGDEVPIEFKDYDDPNSGYPLVGFRDYHSVSLPGCNPSDEGLQLTIVSTYPAKDGSGQVAISDVRFFTGP